MDKETLLSRFKPAFGEPDAATQMYGDTGISVKTLDAYMDTLLPGITDDNSVTDDFVKGHTDFLKAMGGQMRHEKAEFVKNYKPQPPTPPKDDKGGELEALKASLEELKSELKGEKAKQDLAETRKAVRGKAKSLKVQNEALWNDAVEMVELKEGMDEKAFTDAVKAVYEEKQKLYFGDGATPYGGNGEGSGSKGDEEAAKAKREAFKARMRSQGKLPKGDA